MNSTTTLDARLLQRMSLGVLGVGALYAAAPVRVPLPCPLLTLTGIPCPFCGMTRSVTALFRADFIGSLRFNPGGIVLIILAAALLIWRPRLQLRLATWVIPAALLMLWVWNIGFNPTFT